jgi:hypothetical protein
MKKEDLPQDPSSLKYFTREVHYVKNAEGEYEQALSTGWDVKAEALDGAWEEVERRMEAAAKSFQEGKASPILYYMEKNVMDTPTLAGYARMWSFSVRRHLKLKSFRRLNDKKLGKYAKAFRITIDELKNFDGNNNKGL